MTEQMSIQKAKIMAMLQYLVLLSTLFVAGMVWFMLKDDVSEYLVVVLTGVALVEFFLFRNLALKAERKAQRDLG